MTLHSSPSRTRVVQAAEPRGRPTLALVGLFLLLGGVIFSGLVVQGTIPLLGKGGGSTTSVTATQPPGTATANNPTPTGSQPTSFVSYKDPQHRFALFVSSTWTKRDITMLVNGQTLPATSFAPTSAVLPNWRIAYLPAGTPTTSVEYINIISAILGSEGVKNITPKLGPVATTIGAYQWSQLEDDVQLPSGANVHIAAFAHPTSTGVVLVIDEALALNFATTDTQDFQPMLTSLALQT